MREIINKLVQRITSFYPHLKKDIRISHADTTPNEFIHKNLKSSIPFSLGLTILFFFVADKAGLPMFFIPLFFIIMFLILFNFAFLKLKGIINKRKNEIDKEVLFLGQYLLIKLYSGKPLLNALIDLTNSQGVASKYIKEIVDDISTGNSIENALQSAIAYSPSDKFRKILFHINNALKLGIDVTGPLSSVLEEITKEQETEVKRYGKKVNSIIIFYMLAAVVIPSIGMTILIVILSFVSFSVKFYHFLAVLFFILIIEFLFMSVFKSMRPAVNI